MDTHVPSLVAGNENRHMCVDITGIAALILWRLLKLPGKGFVSFLAGVILVWGVACFFWPGISPEAKKTKPAKYAPAAKMTAGKPYAVPAGKIVHTGLYVKEGQSVEFFQDAPRLYFLRGVKYNVRVESTYWKDRWTLPGEIQICGGPKPTTVRIALH